MNDEQEARSQLWAAVGSGTDRGGRRVVTDGGKATVVDGPDYGYCPLDCNDEGRI